ncbi:hypothetical protein SCD_n02437 [Sulfuricella denitrificans skB26]|uniref:ABC-type transport auxiliary lipoprotein component domain-containing protein n=1 Tax=Sulfuricella denitrificans (strain DSM 22764 / NBRC 105220 / skB26) TaxID=1163617 RepID=S6AAU6_SULDS|nr:PqiC family protein [Sulfuricella denitrificans]BAN36245.1 hypothetical protein SCD_n02437 [Sulfuricella denitrificans skB26]
MKLGAVLAASLLLTLAACATPAKTRYYTLSGVSPPSATEVTGVPDYRVAIGPVTVPDALDRQQIVLRVAPNRNAILDDERWSEPLKREIPRVLAEEVGQRLPAARVAVYLQYGGQGADYRVLIDVLSFESVPGESITLEAAWSVRNRAGERLREAHSVFVERVNAPGVTPLVSAHAKALDALGREIAEVLDSLTRAKR